MPKNNYQVSPLDKIAEQVEKGKPLAKPEAVSNNSSKPTAQEQEAATGTTTTMEETATGDRFVPAEKEKRFYHVQLEKPLFNKRTGERMSKPFVQKLTVQGYRQLTTRRGAKDKSNAEKLGYTVKVLWNPETDN